MPELCRHHHLADAGRPPQGHYLDRCDGGVSIVTLRRKTQLWAGQTFVSLKYPNYRLWFIGQLVSLVGTWMQSTAQGYLVYQLTQSAAFLGYVSFAAGVPSWIFTLYAGAVADRISRRTLMIITQTSMMLLAFVLAGLVFTHLVQPWHIIVMAFLLGIANAFDAPARQAFVLEMVEREDLTNAIALNSTMFNSAVIVGPAVGGLTYGWVGPGWCFTLNGLSFIAVIAALAMMKLKPIEMRPGRRVTLNDLKEGLRYVIAQPVIRSLILSMGVISMAALGIMALIPAWSVEILKGGPETNGLLLSARGVGSLIGAILIASLGRFSFRGKLWTAGSILLPVFMLLFSVMRWLPLSMLVLAGTGWGFMMLANTTNAMVQTEVLDEFRGRVMGVYTMIFFGGMPVGSLIAGTLAQRLNEPVTVVLSAVLLLVFALFIWLRVPIIRKLE